MEVFKNIYQLFNTRQALIRQISLFSLVGLLIIFFNNFTSSWTNLLFNNFYINPPSGIWGIRLSLAAAILIFIYITGYTYKLLSSVNPDGKFTMPDFDLEPFAVFVRMIPIFLIWIIHYLIMFIVGSFVVYKLNPSGNNYLFYAIMLCFLPFIFIIFAKFAGEFKYRLKYFSFSYLLKVIDKSLGDVIFLSLEIIIPAAIAFAAIYGAFEATAVIKSDIWLFGCRYFIVCLSAYLFVILELTYLTGLAKIAQKSIRE